MTTIPQNKRLFSIVLWFFAACLFVIAITSCSPYTATPSPAATPSAAPSLTATAQSVLTHKEQATPLPSCTVTAYTLYMRRGAGMSYAVKQILANGDRLQVTGRAGNWLKIVSPQRLTGWVHSNYCR